MNHLRGALARQNLVANDFSRCYDLTGVRAGTILRAGRECATAPITTSQTLTIPKSH